jgi:hypothetical protein
MVRLITNANGVAALLFHVEHLPGQLWHYRWRITGDAYPPRYCQWREEVSRDARAAFHPEIIGCPLEVEWREDAAGEWRQAALHEAAVGHAGFRVKAVEDFLAAAPFEAVSSIAGGGVAHYRFAPLELAAGIETVIQGVAVGDFPDNILLRPGEFFSRDPRLEIENLEPSTDSFVPVDGVPSVRTHPAIATRRLFAFVGQNFQQEILAEKPETLKS